MLSRRDYTATHSYKGCQYVYFLNEHLSDVCSFIWVKYSLSMLGYPFGWILSFSYLSDATTDVRLCVPSHLETYYIWAWTAEVFPAELPIRIWWYTYFYYLMPKFMVRLTYVKVSLKMSRRQAIPLPWWRSRVPNELQFFFPNQCGSGTMTGMKYETYAETRNIDSD